MAEPPRRQDLIAGKLAVASGFCTQDQVDEATRAIEQLGREGTRLTLSHVLLKKKFVSAMQYRLLNMGTRYERDRDEDMAFARFLVKNKYMTEAKVTEAFGDQDPLYREGKEFPRIWTLLEEGNYLPKDEIQKALRMARGLGRTMKELAASGMAGAPPAPPLVGIPEVRPATVREDVFDAGHCRVAVHREEVEGPGGKTRAVTVLAADGQLDAHAFSEFDTFLTQLIEKDRIYLVMDMARLKYISSAGIGVLAGTARRVRDRQGDIRLAAVPEGVMTVLSVVGFGKVMQVFPAASEAVASFRSD